MKFYCDYKELKIDRNIGFELYELKKLANCLEFIKANPEYDLEEILNRFKIKGLKFKIAETTYYASIFKMVIIGKENNNLVFSPNTFIFDFGNEYFDIAVTVEQKCLKSRFEINGEVEYSITFCDDTHSVNLSFNLNGKEGRSKLDCYKDYFKYQLDNLESLRAEYIVDIEMIREYYE